MATQLKIDFVSDVSCPWCVIGLQSLKTALATLKGEIAADLHFQPFELNPQMGAEGQDIMEHIAEKYGSTPTDIERNAKNITSRGAELGFDFNMRKRAESITPLTRIDCCIGRRLKASRRRLRMRCFSAYFTEGRNPSDDAVLLDVAQKVGLDAKRTAEILNSDEFAGDMRAPRKVLHGSRDQGGALRDHQRSAPDSRRSADRGI